MNYTEEILSYYNDDKGMIEAAMRRRELRLEEEQKAIIRLNTIRAEVFEEAEALMDAFMIIEGASLRTIDTGVQYIGYDEDTTAQILLTIPSIKSELFVEATQHGSIRIHWNLDDKSQRDAILVDGSGTRLSSTDLVRVMLDILTEMLDVFIEHHNIH